MNKKILEDMQKDEKVLDNFSQMELLGVILQIARYWGCDVSFNKGEVIRWIKLIMPEVKDEATSDSEKKN